MLVLTHIPDCPPETLEQPTHPRSTMSGLPEDEAARLIAAGKTNELLERAFNAYANIKVRGAFLCVEVCMMVLLCAWKYAGEWRDSVYVCEVERFRACACGCTLPPCKHLNMDQTKNPDCMHPPPLDCAS